MLEVMKIYAQLNTDAIKHKNKMSFDAYQFEYIYFNLF